MKICFLANSSSIHTVRWVNALAMLEHDISLLTIQPSEIDKLDKRVKVYELKIKNKFGYYMNAVEARRIIRKINPDIINAHYASGYGTLARLIGYMPILLSVWGSDVYLYPYQSKWNEKTLRKNLKAASQIASTSHAMKKQTEKFVKSTLPIAVTPFGIDLNKFEPRNLRDRNYITIGTVKRLEAIYGIDILILAVSGLVERLHSENQLELISKIRLQIVGEGSERERLKQLAIEKQVDTFTEFIGAVPNDKVPIYLNQFDIYCAFSRSESFGVAILEASACEVPVVVSNVGGLPEVVDDGRTGFVVNPQEIEEIVAKLYELVMNEDARIKMGKYGREFVSEYYDWNKNVAHMVRVYESLIEKDDKL
ncbi:glycosyltransferase [Solibacillus silvestris]